MSKGAAAQLAGALAALLSLGAHGEGPIYAIDPTHTFVNFEATHFGVSTSCGRFDRKRGTVEFDRAGHSGRAEISVETSSVSTGVAALDNRLCAPEFLDCESHPTARFTSERFAFDGDKVSEVAGSLWLRGRTLPLTLRAVRFNCYLNLLLLREVCGGDFEATLALKDWGLATSLELGLPDTLRLQVQIEAIRQ